MRRGRRSIGQQTTVHRREDTVKTLLVFGGSGQLGNALLALAGDRWEVHAPSSIEVSLLNPAVVRAHIEALRPSVIINAAAYTKVDDAERERDAAYAINAVAPEAMAVAAQDVGAHFVHVSTDYVFDGAGTVPYSTSAQTNPLGVYGASKLEGELRVAGACPGAAIVRTAWLHSGRGTNFVRTALQLLSAGTSMRVVDDQVGTPTRARTVAAVLLQMAERRDIAGLHHCTDAGVASWYDVAVAVRDALMVAGNLADGVTVVPVNSAAFPRPARRPAVAILDTYALRRTLGWTPPPWRDGVRASVNELLGGRGSDQR